MGILKQQFKQGWCESVFASICVQPLADKCEFVIYITISKKKKNHGLSPCFKSYTHCFTQVIANPPTGARLYFCVINIPFTVCKFD